MPSYAIAIPNSLNTPGATTDTGAASQTDPQRGLSFNGIEGDEAEIYASSDNFVTDVVFVSAVTPALSGGQVVVRSIARYYRAIRTGIANPGAPNCTAFLADVSSAGSGGGSNPVAAAAQAWGSNASAQSIPSGVDTPITNWTALVNGGQWDPVTGIYTVAEAGQYAAGLEIAFSPAGAVAVPDGFTALLQRSTDGGLTWTTVVFGRVVAQAAVSEPFFPGFSFPCMGPFNAGDLLRPAGTQTTGAAVPIAAAAFSIALTPGSP